MITLNFSCSPGGNREKQMLHICQAFRGKFCSQFSVPDSILVHGFKHKSVCKLIFLTGFKFLHNCVMEDCLGLKKKPSEKS